MEQMNMHMHIGAVLLLVLIVVILFSLLVFRMLNELDKQIEKNERHKTNVDNGYYLAVGEVGWSELLGHYVKAVDQADGTCNECVYNISNFCPRAKCMSFHRKDGKCVSFVKHEQDEKDKSTPVELQG